MVNLRITKLELEQLILWGSAYRDSSGEVRVPFEPDELKLIEKLKAARKYRED